MKYDVYKGTKKDFKESKGEQILSNLGRLELARRGIPTKALDGDLIPSTDGKFICIEEAI